MTNLTARLAEGTMIIDGGTGTELERRGVPMVNNAWCAMGAATHPDELRAIHRSYIDAGVEVIIANTYATSRHLLEFGGIEDRFEELNRRGVEIAIEARKASGRTDVLVAGSISTTQQGGPFPPIEDARVNYLDQARILAEAGADLIILEMMRDIDHTQAALDGAATTGLPIWMGYSCVIGDDGVPMLWNGEHTLADGLAALDPGAVELVAIMHTETIYIDACIDVVKQGWQGPVGVYAHCGHFVPPHWQFIDIISPEDYHDECVRWVEAGVDVIGGCCGIGPDHIKLLIERFG